ncbi:hypothetical protein CMT41_08335 [Colwellia sp. MT41]|uniref:hypothetical protein n=1 Tax=Colwellia sp. MT41 TaxID=58049 RepID=UPI00071756B1|nr:hypothetical protein [Colwellia sp. MT41]ALO34721.1 hypothetical protein CMT41_08335 [Colwellia sp. MT41]
MKLKEARLDDKNDGTHNIVTIASSFDVEILKEKGLTLARSDHNSATASWVDDKSVITNILNNKARCFMLLPNDSFLFIE